MYGGGGIVGIAFDGGGGRGGVEVVCGQVYECAECEEVGEEDS